MTTAVLVLALLVAVAAIVVLLRRSPAREAAELRRVEEVRAAEREHATETQAIDARHAAAVAAAYRELNEARAKRRTQRAGALVAAAAEVTHDACPRCLHWRHVGRCDDCACEVVR